MKSALRELLFSSRPRWAMMPGYVAENFVDNLLFLLSLMEERGLAYMAHFGTLLGAVRLGGTCPWDEDADIYLLDENRESVERALKKPLEAHGFRLIYDPRDFFWVKQNPWWAGQGHIGLSFLPTVKPAGSKRPDHPEDPAVAYEELFPLSKYSFHGTWIWGPSHPEPILERLYGASGSPETMSRFEAPAIPVASRDFWRAARKSDLEWPTISARFMDRKRHHPLQHMRTFPWWWWNGAYNVGIKRLRAYGQPPR
jgi:LicD family